MSRTVEGLSDFGQAAYETVLRRMLNAGYTHQTQPTRFLKSIPGAPEPVKVDVLSGQYQTDTKSASVQVNDLHLGCLKGIDLAFEASEEMTLNGQMPNGAQNQVRMRIVRPEVFILIKAFALDERLKSKDAYDIAFILHHYKPSLAALAEQLRPHIAKGLGREAFAILKAKFASLDSIGPVGAADAVASIGSDVEALQRAAFEDAQELFRQVDQ